MATYLDPSITTSDNLSGQVVARKGDLPEIHSSVAISVNLMSHMVLFGGHQRQSDEPYGGR